MSAGSGICTVGQLLAAFIQHCSALCVRHSFRLDVRWSKSIPDLQLHTRAKKTKTVGTLQDRFHFFFFFLFQREETQVCVRVQFSQAVESVVQVNKIGIHLAWKRMYGTLMRDYPTDIQRSCGPKHFNPT